MKKIVSGVVALAMVLSLSVPVSAIDAIDVFGEDSYSIDMKGTYQKVAPREVICVDIKWDEMKFTYTEGSAGTWDEHTHAYVGIVPASWSDAKSITITNHSNVKIEASFDFRAAEGIQVAGVFNHFVTTVGSADKEAYKEPDSNGIYPAPQEVVEFSIDANNSTPPFDATVSLGTITVKIKKFTYDTTNV